MSTKTKKPSLNAQLKAAKTEAAEQQLHAASLQKKLDESERMKTHYQGMRDKAEAELNGIHAFLDAVPNPPSRKTNPEFTSYAQDVSAMTRLSVFLATR